MCHGLVGRVMPILGVVKMSQHQVLAQDFNLDALRQIAEGAEFRANLIKQLEPKPWRRGKEQNDTLDTFQQLARYCRKTIAIANGEPAETV